MYSKKLSVPMGRLLIIFAAAFFLAYIIFTANFAIVYYISQNFDLPIRYTISKILFVVGIDSLLDIFIIEEVDENWLVERIFLVIIVSDTIIGSIITWILYLILIILWSKKCAGVLGRSLIRKLGKNEASYLFSFAGGSASSLWMSSIFSLSDALTEALVVSSMMPFYLSHENIADLYLELSYIIIGILIIFSLVIFYLFRFILKI